MATTELADEVGLLRTILIRDHICAANAGWDLAQEKEDWKKLSLMNKGFKFILTISYEQVDLFLPLTAMPSFQLYLIKSEISFENHGVGCLDLLERMLRSGIERRPLIINIIK